AIALARGTAAAAGIDPDSVDVAELAGLDLRTLPPVGVPVALGLIHAAQLERDLAEIEAQADPAALALLDAVVAASGWRDEVPEPVAVADLGPALLRPVRVAAVEMPFPTERPKIETAAQLAPSMSSAIKTLNKLNGISGKVLNDATLVLTGFALVPGVGGLVAGGLATAAFVFKTSRELEAYGYPTRFTRLELELSSQVFENEDDHESIRVKSAEADVASEPWNVTLKVFDTLRAAKPGGATLEVLKKRGLVITQRSDRALSWIGAGGTGADAASNLIDRPGNAVPKALVIPAHHWRGIDMMDADFVDLEIMQRVGDAPAIDKAKDAWGAFEAINAGRSDVVLTAPRSKFGDEITAKKSVEVRAIEIEATSSPSNPERASAHRPLRLCFSARGTRVKDKSVTMTLTGGGKEYGPVAAEADGSDVCFTVDAVSGAGRYEDCQAPPDSIKQTFQLQAESIAERGARRRADPRVLRPARRGLVVQTVERTVEERRPKPEHCEGDLEGNWNFTFANGVLECKRLPFPVTLPGFSSPVVVEDLDSGAIRITGARTGDEVLLEPTGAAPGDGEPASYRGRQTLSADMGLGSDLKADYLLFVRSFDAMDGELELKDTPYQGDICSIRWPFTLTPIE
ncbi:MAG: hypothetical protein AAGF23_01775, partial [Acidobacteriota bacterium]